MCMLVIILNYLILLFYYSVSISVITIEGTDCNLAELGRVADITGGQVNIVKPMNLTKEFGTILADPIIATNVTAVFTVHNQL